MLQIYIWHQDNVRKPTVVPPTCTQSFLFHWPSISFVECDQHRIMLRIVWRWIATFYNMFSFYLRRFWDSWNLKNFPTWWISSSLNLCCYALCQHLSVQKRNFGPVNRIFFSFPSVKYTTLCWQFFVFFFSLSGKYQGQKAKVLLLTNSKITPVSVIRALPEVHLQNQ